MDRKNSFGNMEHCIQESSDSESEPEASSSQDRNLRRPSMAMEKRQYHNQLERKRRHVLRDSFLSLATLIPYLAKNKPLAYGRKASRAKILMYATKYLKSTEQKRPSRLEDIRNLKRETSYLEAQLRALKSAEASGNMSTVGAIFADIDQQTFKECEPEPTDDEDDEEDMVYGACGGPDNDDSDCENVAPEEGESDEESSASDSESSEGTSSEDSMVFQ